MGGIDDYPANGTVPSLGWSLLLPKGTDIRFGKTAGGAGNLPDGVQVYPASGMTDPTRWYLVCDVDDAAYGFENEYRIATLRKLVFGDDPDYSWIPPYPAGSDL